ncbi:hypothetical protein [Nocardia sp. NBC_00416]|uniref:hypothetical protein n=1 Tax=Nocardia sp. NBC_00416 TaxID=2975991 RepID=UPI002E1D82D1
MTGKSVKLVAALLCTGAATAWSAGPAAAADHVVEWRGVVVTVSGANSEVVQVRTPFGLLGQAKFTYAQDEQHTVYSYAGAHFPFGSDVRQVVPGRITQVSACVAQPSSSFQESFSAKPPGWNCSPTQVI